MATRRNINIQTNPTAPIININLAITLLVKSDTFVEAMFVVCISYTTSLIIN